MRIFIFTDSKCVQPTMKTSIEETNVVSAFNEAYRISTNYICRPTNFEETTMNGLHRTTFVVEISLFNIYFFSINEIKYLYSFCMCFVNPGILFYLY